MLGPLHMLSLKRPLRELKRTNRFCVSLLMLHQLVLRCPCPQLRQLLRRLRHPRRRQLLHQLTHQHQPPSASLLP